MVQRRQRERSLFEVLLPDGHKWVGLGVIADNLINIANYRSCRAAA